MNLEVDVQTACEESVPDEDDIRNWVQAALRDERSDAEVSIRLVGEEEMSRLNRDYRDREGPTNVLSFPTELPPDLQLPHLGDIVICAAVVEREASQQCKSSRNHWTHMLVHGSLHLLGYDHIESADADIMETLETSIMQSLGCPDPYNPEAYASNPGDRK